MKILHPVIKNPADSKYDVRKDVQDPPTETLTIDTSHLAMHVYHILPAVF